MNNKKSLWKLYLMLFLIISLSLTVAQEDVSVDAGDASLSLDDFGSLTPQDQAL